MGLVPRDATEPFLVLALVPALDLADSSPPHWLQRSDDHLPSRDGFADAWRSRELLLFRLGQSGSQGSRVSRRLVWHQRRQSLFEREYLLRHKTRRWRGHRRPSLFHALLLFRFRSAQPARSFHVIVF